MKTDITGLRLSKFLGFLVIISGIFYQTRDQENQALVLQFRLLIKISFVFTEEELEILAQSQNLDVIAITET